MLYWHRTDVEPEVDVAFACSTNCTFDVSVDQKEVADRDAKVAQAIKEMGHKYLLSKPIPRIR